MAKLKMESVAKTSEWAWDYIGFDLCPYSSSEWAGWRPVWWALAREKENVFLFSFPVLAVGVQTRNIAERSQEGNAPR